MLFLLGQKLQCEDIGQKVKISDAIVNKENTEEDAIEKESDVEEEQEYKVPVTRARTKALEKANILMAQYFDT